MTDQLLGAADTKDISVRASRSRWGCFRFWPRAHRLPPAGASQGSRVASCADRVAGPILLNRYGRRMNRHAATRRLRALATAANVTTARMHPHMLRHTFVTTMLDAGVDLRDVQIAARHADPRTAMRYDRARNNLDRHPNYILAAL
jgi:integrase/recombinase XerD